ncbi:MAG TPA: DinB family protein [Cyclobacteriaceae bacterium]
MINEIDRIIRMLEKNFNKQPWYGSSIIEILKDIDSEVVSRKINDTHSIIELVLHMASWRTFAAKRLMGDDQFQVSEENNFPKPGTWEEAMKKLNESQRELIAAAKKFPEEKLGDLCPSNVHKYTYYTLLHGITQHDVYHLGQIALLRKVLTN